LRKTVKQINPQSVLSFGEYWNNFVLLGVLGLRSSVYVSDRSQPDKSLGWFHDRLRLWLYPTSKGLIFQTEKAREIFLKKAKHPNTIVIGNPIRKTNTLEAHYTKEKYVLMVGRLIRTKHQDILIKIFARLNFPDWKLILVGYDHLKQQNMERLKSLASDLGVSERVVFMGKLSNLEKLYHESSIFAFTSSSEGFPNAIGEAMAAGLPVVAFDCIAGPSEMITDGYDGFMVPLFNIDLFQSRLAALMSNEPLRLRLGSNAKKSIEKFSQKKICEDFYRFVLQN